MLEDFIEQNHQLGVKHDYRIRRMKSKQLQVKYNSHCDHSVILNQVINLIMKIISKRQCTYSYNVLFTVSIQLTVQLTIPLQFIAFTILHFR